MLILILSVFFFTLSFINVVLINLEFLRNTNCLPVYRKFDKKTKVIQMPMFEDLEEIGDFLHNNLDTNFLERVRTSVNESDYSKNKDKKRSLLRLDSVIRTSLEEILHNKRLSNDSHKHRKSIEQPTLHYIDTRKSTESTRDSTDSRSGKPFYKYSSLYGNFDLI